jgi:GT2 family glycosyltransferase
VSYLPKIGSKRDQKKIASVTERTSEGAPRSNDAVNRAPSPFDEDAYLRAFPDVEKAVSEGLWKSALHHYKEHGEREQRLWQDGYLRALNGREVDGHIDFCGHSSVAGGWIFCGWTAEQWDETSTVRIVAHFGDGDISGESIGAFHHRSDLEGCGVGLVLFVLGPPDLRSHLTSIDVCLEGLVLTISIKSGTYQIADQELLSATRSILSKEPRLDGCRELLPFLSTSGYGRLKRQFNTLSGFVDCYGYHSTACGWFFSGWVTRSWDDEVGPDKLTARFGDDDEVGGKTITGFYPRDDLNGQGVGFVMFMHGPSRSLGPLIFIELQVDGVSSFINPSAKYVRIRDQDLIAQFRPSIELITTPDAGDALQAVLSQRPYSGVDTLASLSEAIFLGFDELIACPPDGLVIMGWLLAKPRSLYDIRLRSSLLNEQIDLNNSIRIERPDVIAAVGTEHGFEDARCGFITYVSGSIAPGFGMYAEVETVRHDIAFRPMPAPKLEGISAIKRMLSAFEVRYADVSVFDRTMGRPIELLNNRRLAIRPRVDVIEFGKINVSPRFSVIIPLYGRLDFVECQLAFMSSHQAAFDYEIIFVLDDPPKRWEAERLFSSTYSRFRVPFRVLLMEHNVGFAPASNAGLQSARGTYVCFMNSDVFPCQSDWLERLAQRLETCPRLGVVGPLLLYSDGSVQHEGMIFRNLPEYGNWPFCEHSRKGKRRSSSSGLRRSISITGACMLMRRGLAQELGGFDESYIIGDFEDSDLCLRLYEKGLDSAVDLDVELYHLERKSQASSSQNWRMNLTLYNAWVHQKRWADTISMHPLREGCVFWQV